MNKPMLYPEDVPSKYNFTHKNYLYNLFYKHPSLIMLTITCFFIVLLIPEITALAIYYKVAIALFLSLPIALVIHTLLFFVTKPYDRLLRKSLRYKTYAKEYNRPTPTTHDIVTECKINLKNEINLLQKERKEQLETKQLATALENANKAPTINNIFKIVLPKPIYILLKPFLFLMLRYPFVSIPFLMSVIIMIVDISSENPIVTSFSEVLMLTIGLTIFYLIFGLPVWAIAAFLLYFITFGTNSLNFDFDESENRIKYSDLD